MGLKMILWQDLDGNRRLAESTGVREICQRGFAISNGCNRGMNHLEAGERDPSARVGERFLAGKSGLGF